MRYVRPHLAAGNDHDVHLAAIRRFRHVVHARIGLRLALDHGVPMTDTRRCIWLTREQREVLVWAKNNLESHALNTDEHRTARAQLLLAMSYAARDAVAAYDAAPADPAEAVRKAIITTYEDWSRISGSGEGLTEAITDRVLVALGYPATNTNPPT